MTVGTLALLKVSKVDPEERATRGLFAIILEATRETIRELLGLAEEGVDSSALERFYPAEEEETSTLTTSIAGEGNPRGSHECALS